MSRLQCETILHSAGLDVLRWFPVTSELRSGLAAGTKSRALNLLPDLGVDAWGLFIGNSKALWPHFVRHVSRAASRAHPLDHYVQETVRRAAVELGTNPWIAFSHTASPSAFPMQRLADEVGFAHLGPAHLSVHPKYGPWIALRAVIVCPLAEADWPAASSDTSARPCDGCSAPCVGALEKALGGSHADQATSRASSGRQLSAQSARWLAVRDACPQGTEHRYEQDQILYHYDKNDGVLPR
jgi:methylmalonic aciduria homocystinuria type C protein